MEREQERGIMVEGQGKGKGKQYLLVCNTTYYVCARRIEFKLGLLGRTGVSFSTAIAWTKWGIRCGRLWDTVAKGR